MAREGFFRGLGLLVLLCSVNRSTQQADSSADSARSGLIRPDEDQDTSRVSASAAANALAHSNLGHPQPISTTPWYPPYSPTTQPAPTPYQCQWPEQVIYKRDENYDCQVCVCIQRYSGYLEPVCGYCNLCPVPTPPTPPTVPTPTPPPPPPPPPPPHPTCEPFPTNEIFKNPVDPCLICICRQSDINEQPVIDCWPDPSCIQLPTTVAPVSPTTVVPYPVCQYYPPNVWFKHPTVACYICRCEGGSPNDMTIDCYPDPACEPTPYPVPTTTLSPFTPPTSPQPPAPKPHVDPLPGPPPHPSCRPFVPGRPFQHPWDVCLECICTEINNAAITNVQVNCYTKAECCYIPVQPTYPPPTPLPYTTPNPWPTSSRLPIIHPPPAHETIGSAHANAVANGGGSNGYGPGNSQAQADAAAEAAALAQAAVDAAQNNYINQYPYLRPGPIGPIGSNAQAAAQAMAQSQAQANQALAQALADASANANYAAVPQYFPNQLNAGGYGAKFIQYPQNVLYQPTNSLNYPGFGGSQAQADSNAQAGFGTAQAQADAFAQGDGQAQADAQAQSNSGYEPWMMNNIAAPGVGYPAPPQSIAEALAQAQANSQNNFIPVYQPTSNPFYPVVPGGSGSSQAQAQANADAGAGSAQAAANAMAQELASQAQAAAQASANANRGADAAAQAMASAAASALKSGEADSNGESGY